MMPEQHHRQMCSRGIPALIGAVIICLIASSAAIVGAAGAATRGEPGAQLAALGDAKRAGHDVLVRRVQRGLAELGIYGGDVNGRLDRATVGAVRTFQRRSGLPADGRVTRGLAEAIDKRLRSAALLKRLDRVRAESKEAARQALLSRPETRSLVNGKRIGPADPTRDVSGCLARPTESCLLAEAAESAKAISKDNMRDWALGEILVAQAKAGLKAESLRTASRIADPRLIINSLKDAATAHAQAGRPNEALAAADSVPDADQRLEALAAIAVIQSKAEDQANAARTARRLNAVLDSAVDAAREVDLRTRLALVLYRIGLRESAADNLKKALGRAERIKPRRDRAIAFGNVAAALAEMGEPVRALDMLKAVRTATLRMPVLISAATALAEAGDETDALAAAAEVRAARYRAQVLSRIAVVQAKRGNLADAERTIAKALATAAKVRLNYARNHAASRIALDLLKISITHRPAEARRFLVLAEETLEKITEDEFRAEIFWVMAAEKKRLFGAAAGAATEARARAATAAIKSPLRRVWLLGDLATARAADSTPAAAWAAFREALRIAGDIDNTWSRARAFAKLSVTLAALPGS